MTQPAAPGGSVEEGVPGDLTAGSQPGLVDALCDLSFMASTEDRRLFVKELAWNAPGLPDIRESGLARMHVIEIFRTCRRHPRGLSALAATVQLFAPSERATHQVLSLIENLNSGGGALALVSEADRKRLMELLRRSGHLKVRELWFAASDEIALPPTAPVTSLSDAFDRLAELNARADGLPPALAFVEHVAACSADSLAAELRAWNDRQASRFDLADQLAAVRVVATADTVAVPAEPCLVVQLTEHVALPFNYVMSYWVQYRPGPWHPVRGDDEIVTLGTVESVIEKVLNQAETVWGERPGRADIEFVLPTQLLNEEVDWWLLNPGSPEAAPLCLDYPVVIRSLERMRATNYHRLWRNRWETMISASSIRTHWAPAEEEDSGLWNARLRIDDTIAAVVLGEPPTPASAGRRAGFAMALRAGIPVMMWDRRDRRDDSFDTIVHSLIAGKPTTLANRIRDLRAQAAIFADTSSNEHIGRHIAVMIDNPNRLVDINTYASLESYRQVREKHGND